MKQWRLSTRWIWAMALGAFFGRLLSVYPGGLFFQWPFLALARVWSPPASPWRASVGLAGLALALGFGVSLWQGLALGPRLTRPWAWALVMPWVWALPTWGLAVGLLRRTGGMDAWLASPWAMGAALLWGITVAGAQALLLRLPASAWPTWLLLNALGGAWFWLYGLVRVALPDEQGGLAALLAPILWAVLTGPFLDRTLGPTANPEMPQKA
ncbi:MAG: hypothetical protein GXO36_02245 [Chloroflexi bacterium]|nr:hypothetical protein [Chloroflexota bacterium]